MPKGQRFVTWNDANNAKLLLAIFAAHNIQIDNAAVAKAFDRSCPPNCIALQMSKIRSAAKKLGAIAKPTLVSSRAFGDLSTISGGAATPKKRKSTKNDEDSDDEMMTDEESEGAGGNAEDGKAVATKTQSVLNGRITKPRVSPRKTPKLDYKKLERPDDLDGIEDAEGQTVFDRSRSASEDTVVTGGEYEEEQVQQQGQHVKMEETDGGVAV